MIKYCRCGKPIWVEHVFNGISWIPFFFPADEDGPLSRDERYRITNCPACGEFLSRGEDLLVEPPDSAAGKANTYDANSCR